MPTGVWRDRPTLFGQNVKVRIIHSFIRYLWSDRVVYVLDLVCVCSETHRSTLILYIRK